MLTFFEYPALKLYVASQEQSGKSINPESQPSDIFSRRGRNLLNYSLEELITLFNDLGIRQKFRAEQVYKWLYKPIVSFEDMRNIPKDLRQILTADFSVGRHNVAIRQIDQKDGTNKFLYEIPADGSKIEAVVLDYDWGTSICMSSQVGCGRACSFCASCIGGLERNLTAGEMIGEILTASDLLQKEIRHVAIMGSGEPMDNLEEILRFIEILHHPKGLNVSHRNITLSTCGVIPGIKKLIELNLPVTLAVSLHNPFDNERSKLMPVNRQYPISELLPVLKQYTDSTRRRVSIEYTLISGENDSERYSRELGKILRGIHAHVNLIPLNTVKKDKRSSDEKTIQRFKSDLESFGYAVSVRRSLGNEIQGACGQLRAYAGGKYENQSEKEKKKEC